MGQIKKRKMSLTSMYLLSVVAIILLTQIQIASAKQGIFQDSRQYLKKRGFWDTIAGFVGKAVDAVEYVYDAAKIGVVGAVCATTDLLCNVPIDDLVHTPLSLPEDGSKHDSVIHAVSNKLPKISCPQDQTVWAQQGETTAKVTWTEPTASDPDGATPVVTQVSTPPLTSGALYGEGTHTITYEAKDDNYATAQCSFSFTVNVHRCSVDLTHLLHGHSTCTTPDPVWGTVCTFECDKGYEVHGDKEITCGMQQSGSTEWSTSTPPTCQAVECGAIPSVNNGKVTCSGSTYGTTCPITCDPGYTVDGTDFITCQYDKQWSAPGTCKDVEPPKLQCGNDISTFAGPKLEPVYVDWKLPTATDNSGVTPNVASNPQPGNFTPGNNRIDFTATDNSGNVATCSISVSVAVKRCPAAQVPPNADVTCTYENAYGSECETTCNSGYELKGNGAQTCEVNGTWSGDQPQCERMSCGEPLFDRTGQLLYDCDNEYYLGGSCTTRCLNGNPARGAQVINCTRDTSAPLGHEMQWNFEGNIAPYCEDGQCPKLNVPKDGALACDYMNGIGEFCVPSCNANTIRPPTMPDSYHCLDTSKTWDPINHVPLPDCQAANRHHLSTANVKPTFYYYSNTCDPNSLEIKENFLQALILSNSFVCLLNGCTNTSTIQITCYDNNVGKRDAASSSAFIVVISPEISLGPTTDQGSLKDTQIYFEKIANEVNAGLQKESDNGLFDIPDIGIYDGLEPGQIENKCEEGMILDVKSLGCAGCGEGHYYDNITESCLACPLGSYQDQEVAFQCSQCPGNTTTNKIRARSEQECQNFCPSGTYSLSGTEPCDSCPKGSYQSASGMASCDLCPYGMSTVLEGSTTENDCLFYDIRMTNETSGPWIQMFDRTPQTFTLVTWVHVISRALTTVLTFDIDEKQARADTAYFALGDTKIFVSPKEDLVSMIIRNWYHLALVYDHGEVQLYIDGRHTKTINNITFTDLWKKSFYFVNSVDLQYVVLSHLEMTKTVLTEDTLVPLSLSCDKRVDRNILLTNKLDETLVVPSTCDDTNNCLISGCGDRWRCVDDQAKVQCL